MPSHRWLVRLKMALGVSIAAAILRTARPLRGGEDIPAPRWSGESLQRLVHAAFCRASSGPFFQEVPSPAFCRATIESFAFRNFQSLEVFFHTHSQIPPTAGQVPQALHRKVQPLELSGQKAPIIGSFDARTSNLWKFLSEKFQTLEIFG